ncbi:MAG: zinc transporter ZupT [Candidatus Cloacimonetes bacterium]|nr:zinc transporter ZupT [Candidatus Cloacimonadota bacterium]
MGNNVLLAFLLTLGAGLATGIGSFLAFFTKRTNTKFLAVALGFSAGVMVYVSMIEIFFKAKESLVAELGKTTGSWLTVISFFAGILLIGVIDKIIPAVENPHEMHKVEEVDKIEDIINAESEDEKARLTRLLLKDKKNGPDHTSFNPQKLHRMGIFTALAITIHNFPEGLATFIAALQEPALGIAIAVAIALHNIPEGIAVSVPIYFATGSKKKAFMYSFLSGLAEPLGAIVGYLILMPFLTETLFGVVFAMVGGIMVYISFDELLPAAQKYGEHHLSIYGLVAGMAVMAVSLLILF